MKRMAWYKKMQVLGIMLIFTLTVTGCNEKNTQEEKDSSSKQLETLHENDEQPNNDVVTETVEEPKSVMEEKLIELGKQGISVVVWNDNTNEEHVIDDGESYERQEGDRFFICSPSMLINISHNIGIEMGQSSDNYCEFFIGKLTEYTNVEMKFGCKNGEEAQIVFFMGEIGMEKPIEIPEGYEYYLQKQDTGEIFLGLNAPAGYNDTSYSNASREYVNGGNRISIYLYNNLVEVYEGNTDTYEFDMYFDYSGGKENVTVHYINKYTEKGSYDIGYGIAKLYDVYEIWEEDGIVYEMCFEDAIVKVNSDYVRINYTEDGSYGMIQSNNIGNIVQELFAQ